MKSPSFDFDWEERLFRLLRRGWQGLFSSSSEEEPENPEAVSLAEVVHRLRVIAPLLAGRTLRVEEAEGAGGLRGGTLLLPARMTLGKSTEENLALYLTRCALAAILRRFPGEGADLPEPEAHPAEWLLASLRVTAAARRILLEEFPAFGPMLDLAEAACLSGRTLPEDSSAALRLLERCRLGALQGESPWLDAELRIQLLALPADPLFFRESASPPLEAWGEVLPPLITDAGLGIDPDLESPGTASGTEREAPPKDHIEQVKLDRKEQEDNVLIHSFEKVETAEEYKGGARETDGEDELDEHLEALEEVDLRTVIRGGEEAQSVYRTELRLDMEAPDISAGEPEGPALLYDEWDGKRRRYRKDWCRVYPQPWPTGDASWAARQRSLQDRRIRRLEHELLRYRQKLERQDRQMDGEEIDISALCDELAFRRAGESTDEKVYIRRSRLRHEVAVTVLLDLSLSSDSYVGEQRVLDLSREAVFVLGETCRRLGESIQVLAFASKTRTHCRVWSIAERHEDWRQAAQRLGALKPQGYTRIGPALRHATRELVSRKEGRKLLLLISDGKPNDYDRYEGRHGIADVRQALREAKRDGVHTHALAVDRQARHYLPEMLGPGAWHILQHPEDLVPALTRVYGRLTAD